MGESAVVDGEKLERTVAEEVTKVVESARELQESAASLISKTTAEEEALQKRAVLLDSTIHTLRTSVASSVENANLDSEKAGKLQDDLYRASYIFSEGDAAAFLPSKSHGRFLNMFLGPINVRATRKDIKLKVKEEYNSFRDRTAILFFFFPITATCVEVMDMGWMLTYIVGSVLPGMVVVPIYTGLALRENILRVNGSDIRPWRMDVVWGETAGVEGQVWLLAPILFVLQGFEAYVGMLLLKTAVVGVVSEWQLIACGILLIIMALGNFGNTVQTLVAKSRFKAKMKKSKSKPVLNQDSHS